VSIHSGTIAVTGAGGFIGSHLVEELLHAGRTVRALVHYNALAREGWLDETRRKLKGEEQKRLTVVPGDVCDARCMRALVEGCDVVCHLAALIGIPYSYVAPQSYLNVNVTGTLNVLEACRDAKVSRVIHTSTSEVYGTALTTPMNEMHPLQAQSPYSASKIAADKLAEAYRLSFDLPVTVLRPFNTYGPRQSLRAVIPTIIAQAVSPQCKTIRLGATDPIRDMTFVADTVKAYRLAVEAPAEMVNGKVYNLGTGRGLSVGNLAQMILDQLGVKKPIEAVDERTRPHQSEVRILISDHHLIKRELGWKAETDLQKGIEVTARWIKDRIDQLKPEVYTR
jgi:NAD dependent epimerase/dehydratase